MKNLFSLKLWFNFRPGDLTPLSVKIFIGFLLLLLLLSILFFIFRKNFGDRFAKKIYKRLGSFCSTNFFIGILVLFFMYERTPVLAARLWFLIWVITMLVWIFFIVKFAVSLPKQKQELEKDKEFQKYIP